MERDVRSDLPTEEKSLCHESMKKVEEKHVGKDLEITKNDVSLLGPITPDPNRETGDFPIDLKSPLNSSPHTPFKGVFDPFAPGPDKLLHAPHSRKFRSESQVNAIRRLNFDHSDESCEAVTLDEEILLETVYDTLLEAIVSKQREGLEDICSDSEDGCKTPESFKWPSGVAETCPEAPVKRSRKPRNIDPNLCKKLEF